jgi:hypothetical protein
MGKRPMNRLDQVRARLRLWARAPVGHTLRLRERSRKFRHELAVCAIFREEAPFLNEWIAFHAGIGASHFYLYNNFSTDNFQTVLAPWVARGTVTLTDWPVPTGQIAAYRHCLRRARSECRWLVFIDIDEFLFSPQVTDIRGILDRYADLPAIEVWQLFFGSGGHQTRPALPVTEAFRDRAPWSAWTGIKSIVNPRMIYKVDIHTSKYWLGGGLDTLRRPIGKRSEPALDTLRINHYWSRSLEDLEQKIQRGDAVFPQSRDRKWHLNFEKNLTGETDDTIVPIARDIRRRQSAP